MLVIRMQRTGRAGHAMFRVVVQDSRRTPTSGKVVAALGSYDPHTKAITLDKDKAQFYLDHGAQPSDRAAYLLKEQGVKLPKWLTPATKQERAVRNPDKRRSTRPPEPAAEAAPEAPAEAEATVAPTDEVPTEVAPEKTPEPDQTEAASETPVEETAANADNATPETEATPETVEPETPEPTAEKPADDTPAAE